MVYVEHRLEPALLLGDMGRLDAVACSQFLDGDGEVVANGAFGEKERGSNLGNTRSRRVAAASTVRSRLVERIVARASRSHRQYGTRDPPTGDSPPDGRGELGRRCILE